MRSSDERYSTAGSVRRFARLVVVGGSLAAFAAALGGCSGDHHRGDAGVTPTPHPDGGADAKADGSTAQLCGPPGATHGWVDTIPPFGVPSGGVAVWIGSGLFVFSGGYKNGGVKARGGIWNRASGTWKEISTTGAPVDVTESGAVWTGSKVIVWGGKTNSGFVGSVGGGWVYDPAADSWSGLPGKTEPAPRRLPLVLWADDHLTVLDGTDDTVDFPEFGGLAGGRWDSLTATWTPIPSTGAAPKVEGNGSIRRSPTNAVWTSAGLLVANARFSVWSPDAQADGDTDGGTDAGTDGGTDAGTDAGAAWSSACSLPGNRAYASLVWTGSQAIEWGGQSAPNSLNTNPPTYDGTGVLFTPGSCVTTPIPASAGAPEARSLHSAVWTGDKMIIFGGRDGSTFFDDGASYDPATGQWTALEPGTPGARAGHYAVWTGTEMIVWGGAQGSAPAGCVYRP